MGQPRGPAARRAGDFLFISGVVAVDPARKTVVQSYDELPAHARVALRALGYDTGQMTVEEARTKATNKDAFL